MTQEDKDLLLKDLCARVPYEIIIRTTYTNGGKEYNEDWDGKYFRSDEVSLVEYLEFYDNWKPYLRPMSSMTEEEKEEINKIIIEFGDKWLESDNADGHWNATFWECSEITDYLNIRHFDYRGLIEKGLALEAPEDMYKTE